MKIPKANGQTDGSIRLVLDTQQKVTRSVPAPGLKLVFWVAELLSKQPPTIGHSSCQTPQNGLQYKTDQWAGDVVQLVERWPSKSKSDKCIL